MLIFCTQQSDEVYGSEKSDLDFSVAAGLEFSNDEDVLDLHVDSDADHQIQLVSLKMSIDSCTVPSRRNAKLSPTRGATKRRRLLSLLVGLL